MTRGGRLVTPMMMLMGVALVAVACSSTAQVTAEREPASTAIPALTPTVLAPTAIPEPTAITTPSEPTAIATSSPIPEPTAMPSPVPTPQPEGPCNAGPLALPNPDRPVYRAQLRIDPLMRSVVGSMSVGFVLDRDVDELYLRLWPNGPRPASGGVELEVNQVTLVQEEGKVDFELITPTTVKVPLDETLVAGETMALMVGFELIVPNELKSRLSGRDDYMRLGTIMPILPWEPGVGWALDPATSLFAESVSSPVADYSVTITVPDGYDVLASGVVDEGGTWHVQAARDFALSVGRFRTVTGTAMAPEPVQVTVGIHETVDDDAQAYLDKIIDSLEQFSSRWGQYPWPSLTFAVTPNLSGGIEFPTHIMQGPNTIGRVTSHEVGHMFFYSLVGNNQGSAPWLDEGITSYAEFTYEGTPANAFAFPAAGFANATQPMTYWESRSDIYYRSVYAQVGFALQLLGNQEDVDCALARYVATNAHQIATAQDFVEAFSPTFPDIIERLAALGVVLDN